MGEHYCSNCGAPRAEIVVDESATEAATETVATAEVEIARINADRDIQLARIGAGVAKSEMVAENAALAAENDAQAETIDTLTDVIAPEPAEPAPVVIESPDPEPAADPEDLPEAEPTPSTPRKRSWSWY